MSADTSVREGTGERSPDEPPPPNPPAPADSGGQPTPRRAIVAKAALGLLGTVVVVWAVANLFLAFGYYPNWFANSKLLIGLLGLVAGVGGAWLLFFFINMFVEGLPGTIVAAD